MNRGYGRWLSPDTWETELAKDYRKYRGQTRRTRGTTWIEDSRRGHGRRRKHWARSYAFPSASIQRSETIRRHIPLSTPSNTSLSLPYRRGMICRPRLPTPIPCCGRRRSTFHTEKYLTCCTNLVTHAGRWKYPGVHNVASTRPVEHRVIYAKWV